MSQETGRLVPACCTRDWPSHFTSCVIAQHACATQRLQWPFRPSLPGAGVQDGGLQPVLPVVKNEGRPGTICSEPSFDD
jgi:hypothetical protein